MSAADTIFALSSGPPPAGVAVVRVSGPNVRFGLETLIDSIPEPRRLGLHSIRGTDGNTLDHGLVVFFPAPGSFTGEDVAEFHIHGGRAVVAALLGALEALPGFRPAEAGEFTRRAFSNGKMDLTQVEGLADLVYAETEAQRRQALHQADGALGRLYEGWREKLVHARALIEAELDFPDEADVPGSVSVQAWDTVAALEKEMVDHLADGRGERIRDGAEIVILGAPNAGKSSLLNAIARRDVAIVTPEPGTTRDLIEVRLDLGGYPVTMVDTAGLRAAEGAVEREGIRRAEARAAGADLVLWLVDVTAPAPGLTPPHGAVRVATKIDLIDSDAERSRRTAGFHACVSSASGDGLPELVAMMTDKVLAGLPAAESPLITRSRHRVAVRDAVAALASARAAGTSPLEIRAEDLRRASDFLARITGRIDVEDLLDVIFRDFCIGK
ncbi:MAG TPA: tRNA uridine-5-carboxymethylaminomethyl(34) synthesis GTPase MnmE [Bauldia sp.]|nr:tRNA uridine-5-carboxymethylaminomethyl(34) synthesis GTPase MnmE [Bauldia sp.]